MGHKHLGWSSGLCNSSIIAKVPGAEQAYSADSSQGRASAKGPHNSVKLNHAASIAATASAKECPTARRFPWSLLASTERYVLTSLDASTQP